MPDPLIHIGYHKTGTGWLQREVFTNPHSGLAWIGKSPDGPVNDLPTLRPLEFRADRLAARFEEPLERLARRGLVPVVSLERLSGHPFSGGYDSREIAGRLAAVFPGARVLIVIRRQPDILYSTYAQYVKAGGALPLPRFLQPPAYPRPRVAQFDLRHFEYHRLIAHYRKLFAGRVLVLPYEMLRADPRAFVQRIAGFAAAPASDAFYATLSEGRRNAAPSALWIRLHRRTNRWFRLVDVNPQPLWPSRRAAAACEWLETIAERMASRAFSPRLERAMRRTIDSIVAGRYGPSNWICAQHTALDLAGFGYDVRAPAPAALEADDAAMAAAG